MRFQKTKFTLHPTPYTLHPSWRATRAGFTLIEILIAVGILLLLSGTGSLYLAGLRSESGVDAAARQLVGLLSSAQEKAAGQENSARWGVYIDNRNTRGTYTLYQVSEELLLLGENSVPGAATQLVTLSPNVSFASPTISTVANLIFNKGTGLPTASTTLVLRHSTNANTQNIIYVSGNGRIEYR